MSEKTRVPAAFYVRYGVSLVLAFHNGKVGDELRPLRDLLKLILGGEPVESRGLYRALSEALEKMGGSRNDDDSE